MTDPTAAERAHNDLVEVFRKALMREHHDDWDMETVAEAAHICAGTLEQIGEESFHIDTADDGERFIFYEPRYRRVEMS